MRLKTVSSVLSIILIWSLSLAVVSAETNPLAGVQAEARHGGYRLIDVDGLSGLYDQRNDIILVDTRQEWEFNTGHIAGSLHFSMEPTWLARLMARGPLEQLLGTDRDKPLIFY